VIVDRFGRQFQNLRVSLTASCNYACTYCVAPGERRLPAKYELSARQLLRAVELIQRATGLKKIRITGGEPLVAASFDGFIRGLDFASFDDVSLTTNGQKLAEKVPLMAERGMKRINVSLDTLDPHAFRSISKGGDLFSVLAGIQAALDVGMQIKINMVPLRSKNIHQIVPLLNYCLERGMELRFIELMRMGHLREAAVFNQDYFSMDQVLGEIVRHYTFVRTDAPFDSTAVRFSIPGRGNFGVIANESEPFCSSCTRLRLSSSGHLHGCLSSSERQYVGDLLSLADEEALPELGTLLSSALDNKQTTFRGAETIMRVIGG
jgi:cyclic pyranopterin phosphate synthase